MSDEKQVRLVCLRIEDATAEMLGTANVGVCVECHRVIIFSQEMVDQIEVDYPDHGLEPVCLECAVPALVALDEGGIATTIIRSIEAMMKAGIKPGGGSC